MKIYNLNTTNTAATAGPNNLIRLVFTFAQTAIPTKANIVMTTLANALQPCYLNRAFMNNNTRKTKIKIDVI